MSEKTLSDTTTAILDVSADIKKQHEGKDWHGDIMCPICAGILVVMHSGSNGHTSGRCDTKDCLKWTE